MSPFSFLCTYSNILNPQRFKASSLQKILYLKITQKSIKFCERKIKSSYAIEVLCINTHDSVMQISKFIPMIQVNYQTYLLNPTQNHLVNSTLPIFNLSTQPSLLPSYHTPKTQKSESRKNTSISRKCFIFKPFSVFSSVLLTTILRTPHVSA
mgnify:FL=1